MRCVSLSPFLFRLKRFLLLAQKILETLQSHAELHKVAFDRNNGANTALGAGEQVAVARAEAPR